MNRLIIAFLSAVLSVAAFAKNAPKGLQAGTAVVDISPDVFPMQLRSGPSNYVHDPLHVRAIAFQNGDGRAVIALVDAIGVGREMCDEAKAIAADKTGWKPEEILISATHTHTAPKGGDSSEGRIAFEKKRRAGLAEALIKAIESLEPAKVGFESDEEPTEVRNRRNYLKPDIGVKNPMGGVDIVATNAGRQNIVKPAGPVDPEVCVIDVRTKRGKALGLIANYSLHYVGGLPKIIQENGREVGMASADYYGEFSRIMPYRVGGSKPPENFVAFMTNGTSGDINNLPFKISRPPRAGFEQCRIVASKAADAAWHATREMDYTDSPLIATRQREIKLTSARSTHPKSPKPSPPSKASKKKAKKPSLKKPPSMPARSSTFRKGALPNPSSSRPSASAIKPSSPSPSKSSLRLVSSSRRRAPSNTPSSSN